MIRNARKSLTHGLQNLIYPRLIGNYVIRPGRAAVIGAGLMGHGIAQLLAQAGLSVVMIDISDEVLANALQKIRWSLSKLAEKGRVSSVDLESIMARIATTTSLEDGVAEAEIVIEAVPEVYELKKEVYRRINKAAKRARLIASNTSSIPITELQSELDEPENMLGLHFFNPPQLMPLVEVVKGDKTSNSKVEEGVELVRMLGKEPMICWKDVPGFVVNRILSQIIYSACLAVEEGEASVEEIDSAIRRRVGLPMGIFELLDFTGIDTCYRLSVEMSKRDGSIRPIKLLQEKVERGELGVKSGKGFYTYSGKGYERAKIPLDIGEGVDVIRILAPGINMAAQLVEKRIASLEDVEKAVKLGLNFPKGILELADDYGIDVVVEKLESLSARYGEVFRPTKLLTEKVSQGRLGKKSGEGFYEYGIRRKYTDIIIRREPPIAWLIINRPHRLNALTLDSLSQLEQAIDELREDDATKVLVITGAGDRAFSSGADITSFLGIESPVNASLYSERFKAVIKKLEEFPKPTIAAINGYALGGGCELSLACDFRIASDVAELGQPEIKLGLIPGGGGIPRLVRLLGLVKAKELIMLGERISAHEALRIGLVNLVCPKEALLDEVRRLAFRLAELPPIALAAAKAAIRVAAESPSWVGERVESQYFGLLFSTKDLREGVAAFLERRKPRFIGE